MEEFEYISMKDEYIKWFQMKDINEFLKYEKVIMRKERERSKRLEEYLAKSNEDHKKLALFLKEQDEIFDRCDKIVNEIYKIINT